MTAGGEHAVEPAEERATTAEVADPAVLADQVVSLEAQVAALEAEVASVRSQRDAAWHQIETLRRSLSWRITGPLRRAARWVR